MTASKAASAATAPLTQNSDVTISRSLLDTWFEKVINVAGRLGPTDPGFDLAELAADIALACSTRSGPVVRTLSDIDADIAAVDLQIVEARGRGQSVRGLRVDRSRLVLERVELLMRRQGISPEDVAVIALANHDRRNGRSKVVIELDGHRYSTEVSNHTVDLLTKNIARAGRFTF
jgi:hypothetical protein